MCEFNSPQTRMHALSLYLCVCPPPINGHRLVCEAAAAAAAASKPIRSSNSLTFHRAYPPSGSSSSRTAAKSSTLSASHLPAARRGPPAAAKSTVARGHGGGEWFCISPAIYSLFICFNSIHRRRQGQSMAEEHSRHHRGSCRCGCKYYLRTCEP